MRKKLLFFLPAALLLAQFRLLLGHGEALTVAVGAALIVTAAVFSLPYARRFLAYETWQACQFVLYAALALAAWFLLVLSGETGIDPRFVRVWCALYAFTLASLAWSRCLSPLLLYRSRRFMVEKIVPETTEVESIWITGRDMVSLPAEAGQYALLRFWVPGFKSQAHPFSISKLPDGKYLRFTIKKTGDFTASVHNSLKPGIPVIIEGPYGVFTEKKCLGDKALLIAGGIGITPLRALGERLQSSGKDCALLYANRAQKDIVFRRELGELAESGGFAVQHVLSADPDWAGEKGHIDAGMIKRLVPDFAERDAFLCGPPAMMTAVAAALAGLGVAGTRIHTEEFSL